MFYNPYSWGFATRKKPNPPFTAKWIDSHTLSAQILFMGQKPTLRVCIELHLLFVQTWNSITFFIHLCLHIKTLSESILRDGCIFMEWSLCCNLCSCLWFPSFSFIYCFIWPTRGLGLPLWGILGGLVTFHWRLYLNYSKFLYDS